MNGRQIFAVRLLIGLALPTLCLLALTAFWPETLDPTKATTGTVLMVFLGYALYAATAWTNLSMLDLMGCFLFSFGTCNVIGPLLPSVICIVVPFSVLMYATYKLPYPEHLADSQVDKSEADRPD